MFQCFIHQVTPAVRQRSPTNGSGPEVQEAEEDDDDNVSVSEEVAEINKAIGYRPHYDDDVEDSD